MTASMTAFARKQQELDWGTISCEIRSVNHRFLEPSLRLPDLLRPLEPLVRERLRKSVSRGKVELQIRLQFAEQQNHHLTLNTELVAQLATLDQQVRQLHPDAAPLRSADVLRWQGALIEPEPDVEGLQAQAMALFEETLVDFSDARRREGTELAQLIQQRLSAIRDIVSSVRERLPAILDRQQENIRARLDAYKLELDPARL